MTTEKKSIAKGGAIMKKRWALIGAIFLLLPWLLLGCGVAQGKYDDVLAQLRTSQQELQSVKTELETAQSEVSELNSELEEMKTKPEPKQPDVEAINNELESTKTELEVAKTSLGESIKNVSSLQADLQKANEDIDTQLKANSTLSGELKMVKYPRHFESLAELTEWVQKDETDTLYPDAKDMELAYILQVRAARDGYILPVNTQFMGDEVRIAYNLAHIDDYIYSVRASGDLIKPYFMAQLRPPLYPIPLD